VVVTLAAVLGLDGADTGTVTSTENNLERAFHTGNAEIGILLSVVSLVVWCSRFRWKSSLTALAGCGC
jgi:hypothetical protein